jgi:hypothetical protein
MARYKAWLVTHVGRITQSSHETCPSAPRTLVTANGYSDHVDSYVLDVFGVNAVKVVENHRPIVI